MGSGRPSDVPRFDVNSGVQPMNAPHAAATMEQEFLPIRAKILEIAAALDRLDRANGSSTSASGNGDSGSIDRPTGDPRAARVREAIDILLQGEQGRAEQIQLVFSRPYERDWQKKFEIG